MIGISYSDHTRDRAALTHIMRQLPEDAYSILLYHPPDLADTAAELGIDLYLSGHTHAGQIRVPFYGALFTASIHHKQFERGRYDLGDTTLYVSRGIGMEGKGAPRARFLSPPEVVVIDLHSPGNKSTPRALGYMDS